MNEQFESQRLFSNAYTPLSQHAIADRSVTLDDFVAQLRFDTLLARQVVIPDTYLFDGRMFLELGPNRLFQLLGVDGDSGSLEIEIRAETLERSLATLLERVPVERGLDPRLAGMPFNFLSDVSARDRLASHFGSLRARGVDELRMLINRHGTAKGVASFLRQGLAAVEADASIGEVDVAERGWAEWIRAEREGKLVLRRYDATNFPIFRSMALEPLDDYLEASESLRRVAYEIQNDSHRSPVASTIRHALEVASDAERAELLFLEAWYTRARHRALAVQHRCVLSRTESSDLAPRVGPLQDAVRRAAERAAEQVGPPVIMLPDHFTRGLRAMPGPVLAEVRQTAQAELLQWWEEKDVDSLRTAVALLERRLEFAKPVDERPEGMVQVLASIAGAVTTVGATVAGAMLTKDRPPSAIVTIPAGIFGSIVTASASAWLKKTKPARLRGRVVEYGLWRLGRG